MNHLTSAERKAVIRDIRRSSGGIAPASSDPVQERTEQRIREAAELIQLTQDQDMADEAASRFQLRMGTPDEVAERLFSLALDLLDGGESNIEA